VLYIQQNVAQAPTIFKQCSVSFPDKYFVAKIYTEILRFDPKDLKTRQPNISILMHPVVG
jgi:hypothetical protein